MAAINSLKENLSPVESNSESREGARNYPLPGVSLNDKRVRDGVTESKVRKSNVSETLSGFNPKIDSAIQTALNSPDITQEQKTALEAVRRENLLGSITPEEARPLLDAYADYEMNSKSASLSLVVATVGAIVVAAAFWYNSSYLPKQAEKEAKANELDRQRIAGRNDTIVNDVFWAVWGLVPDYKKEAVIAAMKKDMDALAKARNANGKYNKEADQQFVLYARAELKKMYFQSSGDLTPEAEEKIK